MRKYSGLTLFLSILISIWSVLLVVPTARAAADTCTWTGLGADNNWSTPENWGDGAGPITECDGSGIPDNGDTLIFPQSASRKTNSNDISGLTLAQINITGSSYNISGTQSLTIDPTIAIAMSIDGSFNVYDITTTVANNSSASITSSGQDNEITGDLVLALTGGGDMNFGTSSNISPLTISGTISGSTDAFVVSPDSRLDLTSSNTFDKSAVAINDTSILDCAANDCVGAYSSGDEITIYGGGQLYFDNAITLQEGVTFQAGAASPGQIWVAVDSTITGDIQTVGSANAVIGVQNTNRVLTIDGDLDTDTAGSIQFQGVEGYQDNEVDINGAFTGDGSVYIADSMVRLNSASVVYTGSFNVQAGGLLHPTDPDALGDVTGITVVADGGTLFTDNFIEIPEPITISGAGIGSDVYRGAIVGDTTVHVFSGDITLDGNATIMNLHDGNTLSLRGVMTGSGDLTLAGHNIDNAPFEIGGSGTSADNLGSDYVGHTYVNNARLFMHKNDGVNAIPGDVTVTAGTYAASLWTQSEEQIPDNAIVTLDGDISTAVLVITGGRTETVGTVVGDGTIQLGSPTDSLRVGGGNVSGTFTGQIFSAANAPVVKIGNGTWNFQGISQGVNYADFEVAAGTFLANFGDTSGSLSDFGVTGGVLGGSSIIGPVSVSSGSVAPGNSPGCLYPDGDVVFSSGTSLTIELEGTTICTQYDKLAASGAVTLGGATLDLRSSYSPSVGTVFTIVEGSSISGTFSGLPEGATLTVNGLRFRINYTSTTVTLTALGGVLADTGDNTQFMLGYALALIVGGAMLGYRATRQSKKLQLG